MIAKLAAAAAIGIVVGAGQDTPPDALLGWMNRIAQKQLDARRQAIERIRTSSQMEDRRKRVRRQVLEALGGLPDYHGPLNAKVTGTIHADGYVIEKVLFESLPGYYVTANVYRPDHPGRNPAVLLQAGHTQEGKAEPQLLAANLALKGFVALAFDPVGQGEREQTYDPLLKAPAAGWSVNEHIHQGAQSSLIGEGLARYFIHDAKRSLDYLAGRSDVDPERLGAAGCSGGGALTTFLGALDSRLKAVAPACFPNSYRVLFTGAVPHSEMLIPGQLALGLDTPDLVELSAPVPWLLEATEEDYFTPPGTKLVFDEARSWYERSGAAEKIAMFVGPGPHGTPLPSRVAIYKWMIRWLKDGHGDPNEQTVTMYPNHELLVTPSGHVEDEPGARKLHELILDRYRERKQPRAIPELIAELRRWGIASDRTTPPVHTAGKAESGEIPVQPLQYESEPGIQIDARLYIPPGAGRKPAVLLVAGQPFDALAERIARGGRVVLRIQPRHPVVGDDRRPFVGADWQANTRADLIGISLAARRALDILRGIDLLWNRDDVQQDSISAAAPGIKGLWLLMAAAADARIARLWLDRTPVSFESALHQPLNTNLLDAVIPGFVLHWDVDDLVKALAGRPVLRTDPTNWMGRVARLKGPFTYRWVLGDLTEMSDRQDQELADAWLR